MVGADQGWIAGWHLWDPGFISFRWAILLPFPAFLPLLHVSFILVCLHFAQVCSAYLLQWVCNKMQVTPLPYLWGPPSSSSSCSCLHSYLLYWACGQMFKLGVLIIGNTIWFGLCEYLIPTMYVLKIRR